MQELATILLNLRAETITLFDSYLPTIKFFSALISLLLLTFIIILVMKLNLFRAASKSYRDAFVGDLVSKRRTVKIWKQIRDNLESNDPTRRKFAIIEADKTLDEILKLSGYVGENIGDRLKQVTTAQISNLDDIWAAHKIRNQIAHEPDYDLSQESAERAIKIYASAFRQLGLID